MLESILILQTIPSRDEDDNSPYLSDNSCGSNYPTKSNDVPNKTIGSVTQTPEGRNGQTDPCYKDLVPYIHPIPAKPLKSIDIDGKLIIHID